MVRSHVVTGGGWGIGRAVAERLLADGDAVVVPYARAKAAVEGLTRALAVDYGPRGIRVNAVALGTIATGRFEALLASGGPGAARAGEQVRTLHPLGRAGRPAEAADAVRYLLSDEAIRREPETTGTGGTWVTTDGRWSNVGIPAQRVSRQPPSALGRPAGGSAALGGRGCLR